MLPPIEWKVPSHGMPSTAWPSIWPRRSFISRAALLVKVTDEDFARAGAAVAEDVGDARGQHARLAGAGAGQHQHGAVERLDRLALLRVEPGEICGPAAARARAAMPPAAGWWSGTPGRVQLARLGHANRLGPTMAPRGGEREPS